MTVNHGIRHAVTLASTSLLALLFVASAGCGYVDDPVGPAAEGTPAVGSSTDGEPAESRFIAQDAPNLKGKSGVITTTRSGAGAAETPPSTATLGSSQSGWLGEIPGQSGGPAGVTPTPGPGNHGPGHGNTGPGHGNTGPGHGSGCAVIDYDVVINRASDLRPYARYRCFDIKGHLFIQDTRGIQALNELSGLRSVSGYVAVSDNKHLKKVAFPGLKQVGEGFVVEGNKAIKSVIADRLEQTGGDLHIFNNAKLKQVSLAKLKRVGADMIFAGLPRLTILQMPCLEKVLGTFIYEHSQGLEYLCLPKLKQVGGGFYVHYNQDLKALLAPMLKKVGDILEIVRNPNLKVVDLGRLKRVGGDVFITHNFKWSQCQVDALMDQLVRFYGSADISDNYQRCRTVRLQLPDWCACQSGACQAPDCAHGPGADCRHCRGKKDCRHRCSPGAKKPKCGKKNRRNKRGHHRGCNHAPAPSSHSPDCDRRHGPRSSCNHRGGGVR